MSSLIAGLLGAGVGLGVLLLIQGIRGHQVVPRPASPSAAMGSESSTGGLGRGALLVWVMLALIAGVVVFTATGWPVASVATAALVMFVPRALSGGRVKQNQIKRTEAIAAWTEMVRDNMAGAAGLGQALQATSALAPPAIAPEMRRFAARLDHMSLVDALHLLGNDLNHPSSDLVVVALANAARMESRELAVARRDGQSSPLLSRLAISIREDVRMRLRVEVGRARIRTSARIVIGTTAVTIGFLYFFARDLLRPYDSVTGQIWMCVVASVFVLGGWMLNSYGQIEMPERFSPRHQNRTRAAGGGATRPGVVGDGNGAAAGAGVPQ